MKAYLSYYSALFAWDIPNVESVIRMKKEELSKIQITVMSRHSHRLKGYEIHYCFRDKLPPGAVVNLNQQAVASPALLFIQMAQKISFEQLILLGLQMCSYPVGQSEMAVTSVDEITLLVHQLTNVSGIKNARRALAYLKNGSASIMESLLYMRLALPYRLGGYGLKDLRFNHEVWLSREDQQRIGKKRFVIDLCIPSAMVAIEYMSRRYHSNLNYREDRERKDMLENMGFQVFWIETLDFYDSEKFSKLVHLIASKAKQRIRFDSVQFSEASSRLMDLLPRDLTSSNAIEEKRREELKEVDDKIWDRAYAAQFLTNPNFMLSIHNPVYLPNDNAL